MEGGAWWFGWGVGGEGGRRGGILCSVGRGWGHEGQILPLPICSPPNCAQHLHCILFVCLLHKSELGVKEKGEGEGGYEDNSPYNKTNGKKNG